MLAALGIAAIDWYQRVLSPRKGFCCAHRELHHRSSCSQHAKRAIRRCGFWMMLPLMRRRFDRCRAAAAIIAMKKPVEGEPSGNGPLFDRMKQDAKVDHAESGTGKKQRCWSNPADACEGASLSCDLLSCG